MMSNVSLGRDWSQGISGEGSVAKESEVEKPGVLNGRTQATLQNQVRKEGRTHNEVPAKSAGEKKAFGKILRVVLFEDLALTVL